MHTRTQHGVSIYDADKSQPETAMDRLVVLWWKKTKDNPNPHATRCFSIPKWQPQLSGQDAKFAELLIDKMEELQNKTAHAFVTEYLNSGLHNPQIPASLLEPDSILTAWQIEQESGRNKGKLSAADVTAWFRTELEDLVKLAVAEKKGWINDEGYQMSKAEEKQLDQFANGYCAMLEKLAAPKPSLDKKYLDQLGKAIELLPEDKKETDTIYRKLAGKIERLQRQESEEVSLEML